MRIRRLKLTNFRSVAAGNVKFPGHTVIIGGNSVGKSTMCEALDLLYPSALTRESLRRSITLFGSSERSNTPVPYWRLGSGVVNSIVFSLLPFIAELKSNVIFAMEEPEIAIPPHTQRRIVQFLRTTMDQSVLTTHSPFFGSIGERTHLPRQDVPPPASGIGNRGAAGRTLEAKGQLRGCRGRVGRSDTPGPDHRQSQGSITYQRHDDASAQGAGVRFRASRGGSAPELSGKRIASALHGDQAAPPGVPHEGPALRLHLVGDQGCDAGCNPRRLNLTVCAA